MPSLCGHDTPQVTRTPFRWVLEDSEPKISCYVREIFDIPISVLLWVQFRVYSFALPQAMN